MGTIQNDRFISSYRGDQIDLLLAAMAQANPLPSGTDWVAFIDDCRDAQNNAESAANTAASEATDSANSAAEARLWASRSPYIGENGNWWVYSTAQEAFVDSGVEAAGPQGPQGEQGIQGVQGPQGPKGDTGDAFHIVKTYSSIAAMNADYSGTDVEIGEYVMIVSDVEDPDNAKVYIKGDAAYAFVVDMSGSAGIQGPPGEKGDKGDTGAKGDRGDTGDDGVSPAVTVTAIAGGHQVSITDAAGTQSFDVMDGAGSGDMTSAIYDSAGAVASAGGIPAYVSGQIGQIDVGVSSFNGRAGAVTPANGDYTAAMVGARPDTWTPSAADIGLGNVNNTSDADKPISTATQVALNAKEATANKVTAISSASTDTQYPSALAVYNLFASIVNLNEVSF